MARSTYLSFLMYKSAAAADYTKLVDIKDFPDLGGEPELLETTTLTDNMQTYIPGIQSLDALNFTCNYTKSEYTTIKGLEGSEHDFAVWFGGTRSGSNVTPVGDEGKFEFKGKPTVWVSGGGVNEVVNMNVNIAPSTPITSPST